MKRILVCEDEDAIRDFVVINLKRSGYDVIDVSNAAQAMDAYVHYGGLIDVALLDIMMPGMDGSELCRWLRQKSDTMGIIMLSAKSQEVDKIRCLTQGADDYVTKPFNPIEVMARVKSQLRRYLQLGGGTVRSNVLHIGGIELDDDAKTVKLDGEAVNLTPKEYDILRFLMQNPGKVFSPSEIYRRVWDDLPLNADNALAVHIRHIREKIEYNPAEPRYLKVVWGKGYKMEADPR